MPEVSVIIPNYNHADFLRKRIDSVLAQTFQDFELIILDDCSSDDSRVVIEQYRYHPKVSAIILNNANSGNTFLQWKKGIDASAGKLIWIAESDDWCEPAFLEELALPLLQDPTIVLAFCQSILLTPEKKILYFTTAQHLNETTEGSRFITKHMLGVNHILNASSVVFRKDIVSRVTVPYGDMKYCGDWFFWVDICLHGKVFISGKFLNYYVRHNASVAPQAVMKGLDFLEGNKVFQFIMKKLEVEDAEKSRALQIRMDMYFERKDIFLDENTHQEVLQSLFALDPKMKSMIGRRRMRTRLSKVKRAIQDRVKLFF